MVKQALRAAATASAAFVMLAAPAAAQPVHHSPDSGVYYLEVEFEDGVEFDAVLVCPGGGPHPHGTAACEQLATVGGRVAAIPWAGAMCTMEHRPVTVRAHGLWDQGFHSYQGEFGNYCLAVNRTGGALFDIAPAEG